MSKTKKSIKLTNSQKYKLELIMGELIESMYVFEDNFDLDDDNIITDAYYTVEDVKITLDEIINNLDTWRSNGKKEN